MTTHVSYKPRLFFALLFLGMALSFLWCILENIVTGVRITNTGNSTYVSVSTIVSGYFWLIGHGLHGAAVFIIPSLYWRRLHPHIEENGQLFGNDVPFDD